MLVDNYAAELLHHLTGSESFRFSDLQRIVKNPRTLSAKLKELRSLGLLEATQGSYTLTEKGRGVAEVLQKLLSLLEKQPALHVEMIPHRWLRQILQRYCAILYERFGDGLHGVLLFGSAARGEWTRDSDVDLLVVAEGWTSTDRFRRLDQLGVVGEKLRSSPEYFKARLEGFLPILQEYPLTPQEAGSFQRIYLDACLDGKILYEKNRFLTETLNGLRSQLRAHGARRIEVPGKRHYWDLGSLGLPPR